MVDKELKPDTAFGFMEKGEHEANMNLITAAPDLLEACRAIVRHMSVRGNIEDNWKKYCYLEDAAQKAKMAIQKAEGESDVSHTYLRSNK